MRNAMFRAWDNVKKVMWYNQFVITPYGFINRNEVSREWHSWKNEDWILMQYTGLKDKEGKRIYKGDIVLLPKQCDDEVDFICYRLVGWCDVSLSYSLEHVEYDENDKILLTCDGSMLSDFNLFNDDDRTILKIVGNIYEDPQLIRNVILNGFSVN